MSVQNIFDVTGNDCHNFKFKWDITDFFTHTNYELYSPEFSIVQNSCIKWKIIVKFSSFAQHLSIAQQLNNFRFYNGPSEIRSSPVRVGLLKITSLQCGDVKAFFSYELVRCNEQIIRKESAELNFSEQETKCFVGTIAQPVTISVNRNTLLEFSIGVHDCIIIKGNIVIHNCCPVEKLNAELLNENVSQLQCDFKSFFQNQQFTDVVLKVGSEVIHAHKFVLCARSLVFRKMFEHNMKESRENSVPITDIDLSVLATFLIFLYTGVIEDRQFSTVVGLYSAADKYQVETLQKSCSNLLTTYISASTVSAILILADRHNDDDLKGRAVEFICNNFSTVETSSEWRSLVDSEPLLASSTLRQVSFKYGEKLKQ